MPDHRYLLATVQKDHTVYFLGGHRKRYGGKGLVDADVPAEDCCICMEKLDGAVYDPPGRECSGCNTQHAVKMKCPCGLLGIATTHARHTIGLRTKRRARKP